MSLYAEVRLKAMAGEVVAAAWDPLLHPRARDGKFIEVGGWIRGLFRVTKHGQGAHGGYEKLNGKVIGFTRNDRYPKDPLVRVMTSKGEFSAPASLITNAAQPKASLAERIAKVVPWVHTEKTDVFTAYKNRDLSGDVTFIPGVPLQGREINGIPLEEDHSFDASLIPYVDVDEPPLPEVDKRFEWSAGVLITEPDGRVWLYEPANHFGGYRHTISKGRYEEGDASLQESALREAHEELGLTAEITGFLGDYKGTTTMTRMYTGRRTGGAPWDLGTPEEVDNVKLVTPESAKDLLHMERDQEIWAEVTGDVATLTAIQEARRKREEQLAKAKARAAEWKAKHPQKAIWSTKDLPKKTYGKADLVKALELTEKYGTRVDPTRSADVWDEGPAFMRPEDIEDLQSDSVWESFVDEFDQGSGCDDIACAIADRFDLPQVWGFYRGEPHSWNIDDPYADPGEATIYDAGRYVFQGKWEDLRSPEDANGLFIIEPGDPGYSDYTKQSDSWDVWDENPVTLDDEDGAFIDPGSVLDPAYMLPNPNGVEVQDVELKAQLLNGVIVNVKRIERDDKGNMFIITTVNERIPTNRVLELLDEGAIKPVPPVPGAPGVVGPIKRPGEGPAFMQPNPRDSYGGGHAPPSDGPPISDLLVEGGWFPDDVYTHPEYYTHGSGSETYDRESIEVVQSVRGKPDAPVTVYRAVPPDVDRINNGDWVAVSRTYATQHAEGRTSEVWDPDVEWTLDSGVTGKGQWVDGGPWKVISTTVPARLIRNGGNDIIEWGYWGDSAPRRVHLAVDSQQPTLSPQQPMPPDPGTAPIPPGTVRLYHYTNPDNIDSILSEGLRQDRSRGESYGEPNMVWASAEQPDESVPFVEFYADPLTELDIGRADAWRPVEESIAHMESNGSNVTMLGDVPPDHIVSHNKPWFATYRYLRDEPTERLQTLLDEWANDTTEYGRGVVTAAEQLLAERGIPEAVGEGLPSPGMQGPVV